ncbi:hypothetical protein C8F04DRAFT_1266622 [Mycena alexandri]|uniref:Uncharacterized protein n=1 Tax=Mycena alexandri TaxID=1745969 RepID=A0AAD6SKL2_9AGAR|nr:hypothetical protein C8F04DRAFT_1266622 [Mycena alexandri]
MAKNKGARNKAKTRTWKRVAKKDRRNLKLWAEGAREEILKPHIPAYTDALQRGWRAERDYLTIVCNEFHACIPWRLEDHEEPELLLPEYDQFAQVVEEELDEEELACKRLKIETMNARIGRWLKYRVCRLTRPLKMDSARDPWAIYLAKLAGINSPPKAHQAFQQFMHESYESEIAPVVQARWKAVEQKGGELSGKKGPDAPFRAKVARELFAELPDNEQEGLRQRARDAAQVARDEYVSAMKRGPSKSPEDRQRCIDALGPFVATFLRGISDYTGLHSFAVFGGPLPEYGGEIRTLHVAHGYNRSAVPCSFPQWAKSRFSRDVLDFMKDYLRTAFTPAECAEAALPVTGPGDALTGAKYTLSNDLGFGNGDSDDDDSSESDKSSDSEGDSSESDMESEMEELAGKRGKKERAVEKGKKKAAEKGKKKAAETGGRHGSANGKDKGKANANAQGGNTGQKRKRPEEEGEQGEGGEEVGGAGKKRARTKKKAAAADDDNQDASDDEPAPLSYEQQRAQAVARNRALLAEMDQAYAEKNPDWAAQKAKAASKKGDGSGRPKTQRKRKNDAPAAPPRRSGRLTSSGDDGDVDMPDTQWDDEMPDARPLSPLPQQNSTAVVTPSTPPPPPPPPPPPQKSTVGAPPMSASATSWLNKGSSSGGRGSSAGGRSASAGGAALDDAIPPCPTDAADWFRAAYTDITKVDIGGSFNSLLALFSDLERAYNWDKGKKNQDRARGSRSRPEADTVPKIASLVVYERDWWKWWATLQPTWRVQASENPQRFARETYPNIT